MMKGIPRGIKSSRVLDALAILNSRLDLERLLPTLLDVSLRLTGGERAFLLLHTEQDLTVRVARDRDGHDLPEEDFAGSKTVVDKVLARKAAELLGMSRRTFYDKLIKHNLFLKLMSGRTSPSAKRGRGSRSSVARSGKPFPLERVPRFRCGY